MTKNIYLIRHGQTDYNIKGIVQGRGINSNLNAKGIQQANAFFEFYKDVPFDVIYTSTLVRTTQTIAPFLAKGIPVEQNIALDEIDWGIYEGVEHDHVVSSNYTAILKRWAAGDLNHAIQGGETPLVLQDRQKPFLKVLQSCEAQNILVCSHGRAIRSLLCLFLNRPLNEMDKFPHDNTCLYLLKMYDNNFELVKSNDLSHISNEVEDYA